MKQRTRMLAGSAANCWYSAIASIQITTASISFISSVAVAVSVWRAGLGNNGPYTRLIFSISVGDILRSLALIVGPFAPPASVPQARWSIGNQVTCSASGFLFGFGGYLFAMNSTFLCFYYLCKIKRKMSNEIFSAKFEWKIQAFIIISNLLVNLAALGLGTLNANVNGMFCAYAPFPNGCRQNEELFGECAEPRSTNAEFFIIIIAISYVLFSLIGINACMVSMVWHVIGVRDNMFRPDSSSHALRPRSHTADSAPQADAPPLRTTIIDAGVRTNTLLRLFAREITTQALLYTGTFCLCIGPLFIRALKLSSGTFIDVLIATFHPLHGIFTILIYTRPTVTRLRRGHPEYSWLSAFISVLKFGGGANNNSQQIQEQQSHDDSHRWSMPFGIANIHRADVSSRVEYAGSERESSGYSSVFLLRSAELVDSPRMESGENLEQGIGITLPTEPCDIEDLSSSLKDGVSQDIFLARAIARTQKMCKE